MAETLFGLEAKTFVHDSYNLVDQQDIGTDAGRNGQREPGAHPGRVCPKWHVDVIPELGELDYLRYLP